MRNSLGEAIPLNKIILGLLCMAVTIPIALAQAAKARPAQDASGEQLKFVLVLTRHGVRSPTWTNARLDEYSAQPWPQWPVAPGLLTPHGKQLMSLFGAYYRASFAKSGLLSENGCADASHIYIDADTDQRTVETGRGLAEGLAPGCAIQVHSLPAEQQDPLFHPVARPAKSDTDLALAALSGRIGNDPAALLPAYQVPIEAMRQVLFPCKDKTCKAEDKKALLSIKPSLSAGTGDHLAEIKGPLFTAATFAENFQLAYLEGMPDAQVGWGRADEAGVRALMALHSASSDLVQRTPYIAQAQASNLMQHILHTLEQAELGKPVDGAIGAPSDKAVFLVGHDTNIANIASILDAHWLINGYQRDDAAPGGALVFELWRNSAGLETIRLKYMVQTPDQMRRAVPLSLDAPPTSATIFLPGCSQSGDGAPCKLTDLEKMLAR